MRMFSDFYSYEEIRQQAVDQIPWGHNIAIFSNIKDHKQRLWYIQKTVENSWSRNVLVHQIESDLYSRQGKAITNFSNALPSPSVQTNHSLSARTSRYTDLITAGASYPSSTIPRIKVSRLGSSVSSLRKDVCKSSREIKCS